MVQIIILIHPEITAGDIDPLVRRSAVVTRRIEDNRNIVAIKHRTASPCPVRIDGVFLWNHGVFGIAPMHHIAADQVPPTDMVPERPARIALVEHVVLPLK